MDLLNENRRRLSFEFNQLFYFLEYIILEVPRSQPKPSSFTVVSEFNEGRETGRYKLLPTQEWSRSML